MNGWHTWPRHLLCLTAEQLGVYQSPRKHTVIGLVMKYRINIEEPASRVRLPSLVCLPVVETSKTANGT